MASETSTGAFGRLLQYCTSMGIPMPSLEYEGEELTMSDSLLAFCDREGISLDWLVRGAGQSEEERRFLEAMRALSSHEKMRLTNVMKAHVKGGLPLDQALGMFGFKL